MKKFLTLIFILFSAGNSFAECDLNIGLGNHYNGVQKIKRDAEPTEGVFVMGIVGSDICEDLKNAEIKYLFVENRLAKIDIYSKSPETKILEIASENFGQPEKLPIKDSPQLKSYINIWETDDSYISYGLEKNDIDKIFTENLSIQHKKLSEKLLQQSDLGDR